MQVTELIGQHLTPKMGERAGQCCICGRNDEQGHSKKSIISSSFTDWRTLRYDTDVVCHYCAACLSNTAFSGKALRSYSVIATAPKLIEGYVWHVEDAMKIDGLDAKWGVDAAALMAKLQALTKADLVIMHSWLNYYWYGKLKKRPSIEEYLT